MNLDTSQNPNGFTLRNQGMKLLGEWISPVVVAIALYLAVANYLSHTATFDFPSYYYASKLTSGGWNPYSAAELAVAVPRDTTVYPFLYSPFALQLFAPLGQMSFFASQLLFELLNVVGLWVALSFTAKLLTKLREEQPAHQKWLSPKLIAGLVGLALLFPIVLNMQCGQINLILAGLIAASLYLAENKRPGWAGALLAIAAVIKLLPAGFVLFFLLRKRYKAAGLFFAWSLVFGAASFAFSRDLWTGFFRAIQQAGYGKTAPGLVPPSVPGNFGWAGMFARLFGSGTQMSVLATYAAVFLSVVAVALLWRVLQSRPNAGPSLYLTTFLVVFCPPISWLHYLVFFLPALALLADRIQDIPDRRTKALVWLALLTLVGGYNWGILARIYRHVSHGKLDDYVNNPPLLVQFFFDLNFIAMSAVAVGVVFLARSLRQREA